MHVCSIHYSTVFVPCSNLVKNTHKLVYSGLKSRNQVLRAFCHNLYTVMIMMAGKLRNPITVDNCQRKWEMRSQQPHWNDEMIAK